MIIGIDASKITKKEKTGIDNTAYQIISNLIKIDFKNKYYLYTRESLESKIKNNVNVIEKLIPFPKFWTRFRLPLALFRDKPDAFLALTSGMPAMSPKKSIILIHDLAFKYFPEAYSKIEQMQQEMAIQTAISRASTIVVTSEANKKDFLAFYSFPEKQIRVVPLAYDKAAFKKIEFKDVMGIKGKYFLFVGRLEARKNVVNIVKAFQEFKNGTGSGHKLVLAGKPGYEYEKVVKQIESDKKVKNDIVMPGFINAENLPDLYAGAEALIYSSLYEGFGIPILEAFAVGTPVITSDVSTIKEVAADAAILVDPKNTSEIATAMESIITNSKLRNDLVQKGLKRSGQFDWFLTAEKFKKILEEKDGK